MIGLERYKQVKDFQQYLNDSDVFRSSVIASNWEVCFMNSEIMQIIEDYVKEYITSEDFSLDYIEELMTKLKIYTWIEVQTSTNLTQMLVNLILNTVLIPNYLKPWQTEKNYQEIKRIIDRQLSVFDQKINNATDKYTVEIWNINELSTEIRDNNARWIPPLKPRTFHIGDGFWFNIFLYDIETETFNISIPINLENKINKFKKTLSTEILWPFISELLDEYNAENNDYIGRNCLNIQILDSIDTDDIHNNWDGAAHYVIRISKKIDIINQPTKFFPFIIPLLKFNNYIISRIIKEYWLDVPKKVQLFSSWNILNFTQVHDEINGDIVNMGAISQQNWLDFEAFKMTDKNPVYLKDVGGQKQAKKQIEQILDRIKKEALYKKLWAKVEKGIIFEWPTGTGKTLLARVIATEVDAMIYNIKSTDIQSGSHLNEGAKNMKLLFKFLREKRKKSSKRIIVIFDEMDTLFWKRWASINASQEDAKVVNAFLSEQNGMDDIENVIFIGTTNRRNMIDEAVLRRFGDEVKVDLPDHEWLLETYKIYVGKLPDEGKNLFSNIELDKLATKSKWFSQAQVEIIVNKLVIKRAFEATSLEDIKNVSYDDVESVIKEVKKEETTKWMWFIQNEK